MRSIDGATREILLRMIGAKEAFASVGPGTLDALVSCAQIKRARKGETIYAAGDDWERLGFVIEGSLAMITSGGRERRHLYEHMHAGCFFGVSAVFDGQPEMGHTIVLSREASYAWFPRRDVHALIRGDGSFAIALGSVIARRLRRVTALLAEQLNCSARERIARFLLNFAGGNDLALASDPLPTMTQAQIAAAAGTVKEVAARIIAEFEQEEALRRERGRIRYLNRRRLVDLAGTVQ